MELLNQKAKRIMEECKSRARDAGLCFGDSSLEYLVTNKDMTELSPKLMIPTLYNYWVNDVEVLKGKGIYEAYPNNPFETVINSRPAISFYNDNNPDWLNIMIFYHVLAHIDFFQNNRFFKHTWNDDFVGQALADKRLIEQLRGEQGRWVDYVIEFARSIDNITNFYNLLHYDYNKDRDVSLRLNYYFEVFLQQEKKTGESLVFNEIERYNGFVESHGALAESIFFSELKDIYPEFNALFTKWSEKNNKSKRFDLLSYINDHSPFLAKQKNIWMKEILAIVRNTANYFAPQIRTKILNEGWASYWHDNLFTADPRITGHEVDYALVNAKVTSISRVGLNPYAIGLRLVEYVKELSNKGKFDYRYSLITNAENRLAYNKNTNQGTESIFKLRSDFSDFSLINTFIDQDFIDKHELFVTGKRINKQENVIDYYVKSRNYKDYKRMITDSLYHPPKIDVDEEKTSEETLYLTHLFEGKQLVFDDLADVLRGLEFLWGGEVQLETTEIHAMKGSDNKNLFDYKRVVYTMSKKKIKRAEL